MGVTTLAIPAFCEDLDISFMAMTRAHPVSAAGAEAVLNELSHYSGIKNAYLS